MPKKQTLLMNQDRPDENDNNDDDDADAMIMNGDARSEEHEFDARPGTSSSSRENRADCCRFGRVCLAGLSGGRLLGTGKKHVNAYAIRTP